VAAGEVEPSERGVPRISQPSRVWPHTSVAFVAVISPEGELAVAGEFEETKSSWVFPGQIWPPVEGRERP